MQTISRRKFMATASSLATVQMLTHPVFGAKAPGNKLNLACIGLRMGFGNLKQCTGENIIALCEVDTRFAAEARRLFPEARFYTDYREMFDQESDLDGVIVATPDHSHAVITLDAIQHGLHVYCQKPLTRTIQESRIVTAAAAASPVMTQMGNQGRSTEHIRLLKEWIDDGAIGNVTEVHAWTDRPVGGDPWSDFPIQARPADEPPVPPELDWEMWLGPAQYRPYHPVYHPGTWRGFHAFGTGSLGDMGCHILDPSFYALELGAPTMVEATSTHWRPELIAETYPRASMVRFHFPERNGKVPLTLNWYDGRLLPFRPKGVSNDIELPGSGALLVGDEGIILHGSHGAGGLRILPEEKMKAYLQTRPPKTIPRVKGTHEGDWIRACKDGQPACSSFDYGGALTEMVLLGVLAIRVPNQQLLWDSRSTSFTNNDTANGLVGPDYRDGWDLDISRKKIRRGPRSKS